ncbi:hypothetical protein [Aneurinibacillus tyrosinisolvens]|uniref:hypothetical protein n=1 Tax=Aneurinibacillus tyrosinisolvens TaxID=1443435 RepID=UPI00063F6E58|nr:hypothetical protein [Aneurinibacillus tyrosinisolvens]
MSSENKVKVKFCDGNGRTLKEIKCGSEMLMAILNVKRGTTDVVMFDEKEFSVSSIRVEPLTNTVYIFGYLNDMSSAIRNNIYGSREYDRDTVKAMQNIIDLNK